MKNPRIRNKLFPYLFALARHKRIPTDELVNEWLAEVILREIEEIVFPQKRKTVGV